MPKSWPHATIRELLAKAELVGSAKAMLDTWREAELFRFAIYSFRRSAQIGLGLSVTIEAEMIEGEERFVVKLDQKILPEVTIAE